MVSLAGSRWRLVAGYVAIYIAVGALFPYIPVYYESLGISLNVIGVLAAASAAASMVAAPLWGAAADHSGALRPLLSVAAALAAGAATLLAFMTGAGLIAVVAVALALCMAGVTPILDARAMEVVGSGSAGYGRLRVWGSASFVVAVVGTGWLVEASGIRALFGVLVPALLVTAVIGTSVRSRPASAPVSGRHALTVVARTPVLMRFLAVLLLAWSCATAINAFYSIHLVDIGAAESLVGIAWALGAVVEVPIMLAFPALERRLALHRLLIIGAALFAIRGAALLLTDDPLLVSLTMLVHGGAFALVLVGGVLYVSRHAPPGASATAQGMLAGTVFGLAQVVGPGLGGLLADGSGLGWLFAVASAGSTLAVGALALTLARTPASASVTKGASQ